MNPVVAISCSKSKLKSAAPARRLYQGACFKASVRWAEQRGYEWFVLSAKHGVVLPDQVVAPYRATLSKNGVALAGEEDGVSLTEAERAALFVKIGVQMREKFPGRRFVVLVGSEYMKAFDGLEVEAPLAGMKLGPRVSWLNKQVEAYGQPDL